MTNDRRHPLEVTYDRLGDHYEKFWDKLSGNERDAITAVRQAFLRDRRGPAMTPADIAALAVAVAVWAVTSAVLFRLRAGRVYAGHRLVAAALVAVVLLVAGGLGGTTERRVELTRLPSIEAAP